MKQRYRSVHYLACALRSTMWFVIAALAFSNGVGHWLLEAVCAATAVWCELQICQKNIERDRMSDMALEELITKMPLLELMEAINKREDIKKVVIGESPDA